MERTIVRNEFIPSNRHLLSPQRYSTYSATQTTFSKESMSADIMLIWQQVATGVTTAAQVNAPFLIWQFLGFRFVRRSDQERLIWPSPDQKS
jgi:hypothetical protein